MTDEEFNDKVKEAVDKGFLIVTIEARTNVPTYQLTNAGLSQWYYEIMEKRNNVETTT